MNQDLEHLRMLSLFHYVVAGITALFSLLPILHLALGIAMVTGRLDQDGRQAFPNLLGGWFLIVFALVFIVLGLSFSCCLALAGRYLARRRHHAFCLVMAALACAFFPFGTVLGVFTILVLSRGAVRELFGKPAAG